MLTLRAGLKKASPSFFSFCDQIAFTAANFLSQLLLALAVPVDDFGLYALLLSIGVLVIIIYNSFVLEPMLVFSSRRYRNLQRPYLIWLRRFALPAYLAAIVAVYAFAGTLVAIVGAGGRGGVIFWNGVATAGTVLLWHYRRLFFALDTIQIAAFVSIIYAVLLGASLLVLNAYGCLGLISASAATAGSCAAALGVCYAIPSMREATMHPPNQTAIRLRPLPVLKRHFRFGSAVFASECINWGLVNGPVVALPVWFGLSASSSLRLLSLMFMPLQQVIGSFTTLQMRRYAASTLQDESPERRISMLFAGLSTAYGVILVVGGPSLVNHMLSDGYHVPTKWALYYALGIVALTTSLPLITALKARERSRSALVCSVIPLGCTLVSIPAVAAFGPSVVLMAQAIGWWLGLAYAHFALAAIRR
ncbi:hypothetical protein [Bradyrhizobium liaoningense]|uniref:hypothetical protein n=1 Tax=Bradyrhizobium liaoningense TaxID=43992 RepID=UPI001BA5B222|nr:hypothetical protein [Bradyrhizobium liaoningense]MBR0903882.1 hypothetical protein [Bradyrhizobium liaoningense]